MYRYANGNTHTGEWKKGRRHGYGVSTYHNGSRYEGNFVNDVKEGPGVYTAANGDIYRGEFKADERYGKGSGSLTSADGAVYTGGILTIIEILNHIFCRVFERKNHRQRGLQVDERQQL